MRGSPATRAGCSLHEFLPSRSLLINDNPTNDAKGKFVWELRSGFESEIDNPAVVTDYTVCVYDGPRIAMHGVIRHGGTCGSKPYWNALGTKGFLYRNPSANPDGFTPATLKRVIDGVQISISGKGTNLPLPGPVSTTQYFAQSPNVTVALF